jgi:adenylylsulfate kinase-like enzyme
MYVKARKGLISDFTGISAPYESPESPDYLIDTEQQDIASSVEFLMNAIEVRCCREPESATATLCS